jgi:4-amino-4-deoxy-L-arabinose transferase-like glycosyltransferase
MAAPNPAMLSVETRLRPAAWWWLMLPMLGSATMRGWWAPDEPRYAEVAREIFVHGNGLVMHLCGDLYPDKPPLLFWLSGLLGWLSGWSEFAMRMPSLLATFFTAWLIARIAGRWWGSDAARWAPAVFLTSAMVTEIGGRLQIDPLLTVLCVAALELLTGRPHQRRHPGRSVGDRRAARGPAEGPRPHLDRGCRARPRRASRVGHRGVAP